MEKGEVAEGGKIVFKIRLEVEGQEYGVDGHAIPVEGLEKPEIDQYEIPVSIEFVFRGNKYKLQENAKPIP